MSEAGRIAVVGSSNTDMVIAGERLPAPGETVLGGSFLMADGGKGANQAVAAARLGGQVTLLARVGDDPFGERARSAFAREGIDTTAVVVDEESPSGVALILVDGAGENLISVAPGANERLSPADVDAAKAAIESAHVLLLQLETPLDSVAHAAKIAATAGVRTVLDPAPAQDLDDSLLSAISILTPNETEAKRLTGVEVDDESGARAAAEVLRKRGVDTVIVTLGARGSYLLCEGHDELIAAPAVEAVDTTAAGDTFNGALACALSAGASLPQAVGAASIAAAISTTRRGAQPSMPLRSEIEALDA